MKGKAKLVLPLPLFMMLIARKTFMECSEKAIDFPITLEFESLTGIII